MSSTCTTPIYYDHTEHFAPLTISRVKARRHSHKPERANRKTSGSPQLHHFLKKSGSGSDEAWGHTPALPTRPGLRRYSSADHVLTVRKETLASEDESEGNANNVNVSPPSSSLHLMVEPKAQKRVRLSPASPRTVPPRPGSSTGIIEESTREALEAAGAWPLPVDRQDVGVAIQNLDDGTGASPQQQDALRHLTRDTVDGEQGTETAIDVESRVEALKPPSPAAQSTCSDSSSSSSPNSVTSSKTADTDVSSYEDAEGDAQVASRPLDPDEEQTPIAPVPMATFPLRLNTQVADHPHSKHRNTTTTASRKTRSRGRSDPHRYGTPEMPRGTAKLPHIPYNDLAHRPPSNHAHPKHLPRAEKLPLSGYELLAAAISASSGASVAATSSQPFLGSGGGSTSLYPHHHHDHKRALRRNSVASFASAPAFSGLSGGEGEEQDGQQQHQQQQSVKPIYRRFEALNHRLLLHLQDELSELEEQLHRLDTTDTQTRRLQSSILPASRRAEFLAGGELQWHKTDILGKIGSKLGQYNHLLSSFTSTRDLPAPALTDITEYRAYLDTHQPISKVETRFLDPVDDLVSLAVPAEDENNSSSSSSSGSTVESGPHTRPTSRQYLRSLRLENATSTTNPVTTDERLVTPIPGTMHGNSWRHNRPASIIHGGSSSPRGSSVAGSNNSPRFARGGLLPSPRPLASPLRHEHLNSSKPDASTAAVTTPMHMTLHMAIAVAVAVLVPVLMFSVIPGFAGRVAVVLMVGLSVFGSLAAQVGAESSGRRQAKSGMELGWDSVFSTAVYTGVMVAVAGIVN